jgi:hypothetical protein
MKHSVEIRLSVLSDGFMEAEDRKAVAIELREHLVNGMVAAIEAGSQGWGCRITVGEDDVIEDSCRVCSRSRSALKKFGIELKPFDGQTGIRSTLAISDAVQPVEFDCGCSSRLAESTAVANQKARDAMKIPAAFIDINAQTDARHAAELNALRQQIADLNK